MRLIVAGVFAALLLSFVPAAAEAATRSAYGREATTVADWGNCKNIRNRSGASKYIHRGLVCDLRGHRVNIITFKNRDQEIAWIATVCVFFPKQWVMVGTGFVVTAKDGNRAASRAGKDVYHGKSIQCALLI